MFTGIMLYPKVQCTLRDEEAVREAHGEEKQKYYMEGVNGQRTRREVLWKEKEGNRATARQRAKSLDLCLSQNYNSQIFSNLLHIIILMHISKHIYIYFFGFTKILQSLHS